MIFHAAFKKKKKSLALGSIIMQLQKSEEVLTYFRRCSFYLQADYSSATFWDYTSQFYRPDVKVKWQNIFYRAAGEN